MSLLRPTRLLLLSALACIAGPAHTASDATWWYREPADRYWEGLPLSNGRLAAMVYGRLRDELIPINDETLWSGSPYDPNPPEGLTALPDIRRLLGAGKHTQAQELCKKLLSVPLSVQHYQPLGELRMRFAGPESVTDYRRELDMDSAIARVTYRVGWPKKTSNKKRPGRKKRCGNPLWMNSHTMAYFWFWDSLFLWSSTLWLKIKRKENHLKESPRKNAKEISGTKASNDDEIYTADNPLTPACDQKLSLIFPTLAV